MKHQHASDERFIEAHGRCEMALVRCERWGASRSVYFLCLLLLWLGLGCRSMRVGSRDTADAPTAQLFSTNPVPVEIEDDHLLVSAEVNGRRLRLVLDTGASHVLLTPDAAAAAEIEKGGNIRFHALGGDGRGSARWGTAESVAVGPALATKVPLVIMPVPTVFRADGLLGLSFLGRFNFRLDYEQRLLVLAPADHAALSPTEAGIPLAMGPGPLVIDAAIDGIPARLVVDTGGGQGLVLQSWFVEKHKLRERYTKRIKVITGGGLSGETQGEMTRLPSLKLGDYVLTNVFVELAARSDLGRGQIAGLVGGPILRRFNITVDPTARRIWLEPNSRFAREVPPLASLRSGLVCLPEGTHYVVRDVVSDSPATEAGLHRGDRLLELDGVPVERLTFEQIKQVFRAEPGTRIRLRVQTAAEAPRDVVLVLRDLL